MENCNEYFYHLSSGSPVLSTNSITSLILAKKRNTMQFFPEKARELWNKCELRALILTSLSLQIILILIGNWRKHSTSTKIRMALWLAYLSADSLATVSLGILSNNQEDNSTNSGSGSGQDSTDPNYVIMAFWAPFLLLHLGGPDTITAYALEDNELWLRHLLGLFVQAGVAFYVFLRAWNSKKLNFLAIPIFVAGIIKYGERTWALRSASNEHFRESMLPQPDPGPNYARYMEELCLRKEEGFHVQSTVIEASKARSTHGEIRGSTNSSTDLVRKAHSFFSTFRRLCADLILSYHEITKSRSFFQHISSDKAFEVIEVEQGFMYDTFYTKAALIHSWTGAFLRCISFSSTVSVLVAFKFTNKEAYTRTDVIISYILLVGAIILEVYAVIVMLTSDWTMLWLSKHKKIIATVDRYKFNSRHRWSNKLRQYNLIGICLKSEPPKIIVLAKLLNIDKWLEKYIHTYVTDVPEHLKELIFEQLKGKSSGDNNDFKGCKELCRSRGDHVLKGENLYDEFGSIIELEFDQSILLWHIATDLCYYSSNPRRVTSTDPNRDVSKLLSDYMLYLVVVCPFMLPNGIGQIRFQDTCAEVLEFFNQRKHKKDPKEACQMLMDVNTEVPPSEVKGDRSKSVLFEACILAKKLESLETEECWKLISCLWVEILSYAANQCRWSQHAKQLRRGGELLTHVWLLMAHLGITEQFQISKGHTRAKLILH
ncbi:hypothetical protein F8388_021538 [Cannabis sativa]|uniref:DUF4220 domain-containing protein n=1 Tax=Cannabis sativa TaxID=3483 RepID=A0A7J6FE00_CANSA|nr:hypothetical protein F8388_021538 [Cannabis sativa]